MLFFMSWYFWDDSTMFFINGYLVLFIIPHKALLSDWDCFSFKSLISMFIKWICLRRFSTYSSSMFKLGLSPNCLDLFMLLNPDWLFSLTGKLSFLYKNYIYSKNSSWRLNSTEPVSGFLIHWNYKGSCLNS